MKIQKLYSIAIAAGIMAVLPVVASDDSIGATLKEPCVADVGAAPGRGSSSTAAEQVDFSQLPSPVKATIQAKRGTDVIISIQAEIRNGKKVYCVQFENHADKARPELVIAPDGKLVEGNTDRQNWRWAADCALACQPVVIISRMQ